MILHLSISVRNVLSNLILCNILQRKKSSRREMFAVQCNCKIFAFQGHYLSIFDKKQYRNTLKINPQKFFHVINKLAPATFFLEISLS